MALSGLLIVGCVDPTTASDATSAAESASSATDTATSASPPASSTDAVSVAPAPTPASATESWPDAQAALGMLATLPIKGRAPKTGYDRDLFGQSWTDDVDVEFGRNGCDQRNDLLRRDLTDITLKPGSNGCVVLTGTLADTYTGTIIDFVRGADTSMAVQLDHVVALISDRRLLGAKI
ncbi:hypothetical protein [Rhodococcoides fascians]|uniref:hypothetical protein n=1 Tax=Rhodococcoides fascians TaxID=1828 RepID=UPI00366F84B6